MDLDRPASRSGAHDRPVTRWRREDRPPSRSGLAEDSSRFVGDDRPISRRGLKPDASFQVSFITRRNVICIMVRKISPEVCV